jgi:transposase
MLAELVEVVIGVDTHKHTHTAAVVATTTGAVLAQATVSTDPAGYEQLLELAAQHTGARAWAMEGSRRPPIPFSAHVTALVAAGPLRGDRCRQGLELPPCPH